MIRLKRGTKYFIVIAIFAVSLFVGLRKSDLIDSFSHKTVLKRDQAAERIFKNADNIKKIRCSYNLPDKKFLQDIKEVFQTDELNKKYWSSQGYYNVGILEVPDSLLDGVLAELKSVKGFSSEKIITNDKPVINVDVKEHLENAKISKQSIIDGISDKRLTPNRLKDYRTELRSVQSEIDSLKNLVNIKKFNENINLILLDIVTPHVDTTLKRSIQEFIFTTLVTLIALIILVAFFYFVMVFILYLMKRFGIRTSHSSTGSYNYNYSYGSKYYRRRPKKVKRIYKTKESDSEESEEEEEER